MDGKPDQLAQDERPPRVQLRVDWSAADSVTVQAANQFATSVGLPNKAKVPDGVYLIVGHLSPPTIVGNDVAGQIERLGGKRAIDIHGRYFLTRDRLDELIDVLKTARGQYDNIAARSVDEPTAEESTP